MFFSSWESIGSVVASGLIAYVALIFFLRITGKRTLSKLNAFDLVVTVAIGSSFATVLLSQQTTLAQGVTGLFLLVALQFGVTWLSVRSRWWLGFVKSQPTLLLYEGRMLKEALRRERVADAEIYAALREQGIARAEDVFAVVLETDGSLSVLADLPAGQPSTLIEAGIQLPHGEVRP